MRFTTIIREMKKEIAKGYMFEVIIGELLRSVGYYWDITGQGNVEGRGADHQIDAIAIGPNNLPFINNVRLLAEAKYLAKPVGLAIVRNFAGVLLDVNQAYDPKNETIAAKLLGSRHTNFGVIFSNREFTKDAVDYGYAHNIYLVSYKGNPVVKKIVDRFEEVCDFINFRKTGSNIYALKEWFLSLIRSGEVGEKHLLLKNITTNDNAFSKKIEKFRKALHHSSSVLGFIEGSYPIHIVSEERSLPEILKAHGGIIEVAYRFKEFEKDNLMFWFTIPGTTKKAYFVLPRYLFPEEKIKAGDLVEEKESYLRNISIPISDGRGIVVFTIRFNRDLL